MEASFQMGYKEGNGCKWDKTSHTAYFGIVFVTAFWEIFLEYF
jgi:hypothetical protein